MENDILYTGFCEENGYTYNKVNLDISEFVLDDQLENAVIDKENKTITAKVKYTADMRKVTPTILEINKEVKITPAIDAQVNIENGTIYTLSTKDGSASCDWKINITSPDVISTETPYGLKNIVADEANWY